MISLRLLHDLRLAIKLYSLNPSVETFVYFDDIPCRALLQQGCCEVMYRLVPPGPCECISAEVKNDRSHALEDEVLQNVQDRVCNEIVRR